METWTSSVGFPIDNEAAVQAFVELVSRVAFVEPGESFCIQDKARGGYIEARVGDDGRVIKWSFVHHADNGHDVHTDFSIGDGQALQMHVSLDGQVKLMAQAGIVPQPALHALGTALQDILMQRRGTEYGNANKEIDDSKTSISWTQPSVLNWPPRQSAADLWPDNREFDNTKPVFLHSSFEEAAREFPQRIAIDFLTELDTGERVQFSYRQIFNASNALAVKLHQLAALPRSESAAAQTVAVAIGPSPELYIGYLAALKAGVAFCPIPVDAPKERQAALLADLQPSAILVQGQSSIDTSNCTLIDVSEFTSTCDVETTIDISLNARRDTDAAYILYTSGTTGLPKGVVVSHRSASCTISALSLHFGFPTAGSEHPWRWFQGAAPTFDISLFEIFWTLSTGSTLCCAPRHLTMQNIDAVLTVLQADITNVTPSFASLISPSVLRGLMVGGETPNSRLLAEFAHHNDSKADDDGRPRGIYNGYGPTEVAIYSLAQAHVPANQRGSVIGSPLATCGVLIVDANQTDLSPLPQGTFGEIVLLGPQVSKAGYLNRLEETRKVFVDDKRWGRAYRTGDRARIVWNENGDPVVEFLGRISDAQVKLSGRRVELAEIENVLASNTRGVQQTLACVWKPQPGLGSERVVSLVVVDSKSGLDFSAVQAGCNEAARQHLPDYMRPFHILEVAELPRSASGKANRKAASEYVYNILQQQPNDIPPRGHIEQSLESAEDARVEAKLVRILGSIIGEENLQSTWTATTKLATAGVDSLRAMRLLREIRNQKIGQGKQNFQPPLAALLDPEASIRSAFFASPATTTATHDRQTTARKLVDDFAQRHATASIERLSVSIGALSESDVEMVLPMTSTASQLAVSFAMDHRNYICNTVLPLHDGVSLNGVERAVRAVFERQAVYRTAIVSCTDDLSPFAQVVIKRSAWQQWTSARPRIVRQHGTRNTEQWLDVAQQFLDIDAQQLYFVQLVESDDNTNLLVISIAHCLCDGASLDLLLGDIARQYAGLESDSHLSVQDAVIDWAANLDPETDRHWQASLVEWEADSFHALSGDNVKASTNHKHALATVSGNISWHELETKSRALEASPLSILQAAWSLLLKVWSEANTEDVVFGSVLSGQHEAYHAPTFSVVPCRIPLPDGQTVHSLIRTLVDSARHSQSHRHTSFAVFPSLPYNTALALQAYSTEAETNVPWSAVEQPAIRYDFDIFGEVLPRGDSLLFKVTYRGDALSEISAKIIVRQFAALTELLLNANSGDLTQGLLSHLPRDLLSAEGTIPPPVTDTQKHRVEILQAQFENQAKATPHKLALSYYTSLDSPPTNLTYAELDARANGLANILRLEDADVIPICMHRSVELYVSILAIIKAGSAWSPIDETSPVQRRTSLIARTQGKVLLTTTDSYSLVEPCLAHESVAGIRVIFVDKYANDTTTERPFPRAYIAASSGTITGENLAYLLWTSGTTGEPKGVMMPHAAAAHAMRDLQVQVEHDASSGQVRTLQLSAYSFDVFVQDLFYTWGLAGSVISGTRELVLGTFTEFVKTARPTHAHLTPSFGASIDVRELAGSTLRFVTFIGEKLTEDVAEAWAAPDITTKVYNTYGPAENAVVSTMRQVFGKSRDRAKAANVGFPLTPCTAYVVREVLASAGDDSPDAPKQWELVPRYGVGELALGGAQVGKGYLNNEAKTTKSFIFNEGIGERIYLTGDMVRLNDHGFEFLGRNDDLVKITGIRIELSEISAACALVKETDPALEHVETLYLPRPGGDGSHKVIVSFVSVKESHADTAKIRQHVFQKAKEVLPAYMVPGHVVVLDTTMPRTASNKVDRKALQAIYAAADLNVLAGESTSNEAKVQWREEQLPVVKTIVDNLSVPLDPQHPMGPDDSLAGHGFSSLQITKLAWTLRRQLGFTVRVLDMMRCQTVGELVDVVLDSMKSAEVENVSTADAGASAEAGPAGSWVSVLQSELTQCLHGPLRPNNTAYILPATPVQESLLVETLVESGAYWSHRLFDLTIFGVVDAKRLQAAWIGAAACLDILRTVFVPLSQLSPKDPSTNTLEWARSRGVHATLLQLVLNSQDNNISWTELNENDATADGLASHARKTQVALAPLGSDSVRPPWAVTYAPATKTLMLSMHHALYDGESSRMIIDFVSELYGNSENPSSAGRPDLPSLPLLSMSRGLDLGLLPSIAQRDEALSAWSNHIHTLIENDGALNAPFPDLTSSRQPQTHAILSSKVTIPSALLAQAHNADRLDLPRLVLSAFGCILAAVLELKSIVLGQTVSQRILHPDLARVVGPAVATLPVVVRAQAGTAQDLWTNMSRDASSLGAHAHHLHPVDVKKMVNEGSGDPHAPFPALFVYHPAEDNNGKDVHSGSAFHEVGQALSLHVEHPMALNIFEDSRIIELTGDTRRISQSMLDLLLAQILDQACTMLSYPNVPLSQLNNYMDRSLVSIVGEQQKLVGTEIAKNPAELVAKQVAEHPDWVAIEEIDLDDDDNISTTATTYSQLQVLVDAIVSRLVALSAAQPGDVVAVYLERNTASLAATLAIFKLNYVYLPIDRDLPTARKQLLVRDANAVLVVTTDSLVTDLDLRTGNTGSSPAVFILPEGADDLDTINNWASLSTPSGIACHASDAGGYLLYTSGSTGRPKGVRVTNESLLHYVAAMTQRLAEANPEVARLGGVGKFLNVASRAFDTHLTTMFAPWHLGFCSVIGKDRNGIFANLQHVINTVGITNMGTVPSVLLQLGLRLSDVPSIRVMTFGGEKASHELFEQLGVTERDGDGKAALMNFYGPTEAAVGCLSHVVGHHSNARNLGLPLPGLEAILLVSGGNDDKQIVARRCQPGEFCIAGPQVAVGYLNRPEENARSFQYTTLLGKDGTQRRIYRTGDIMRMMHDGTVEFLGRRDQQTKIRGQRFEIGEVEAHIKKSIADQGALDVAAAVVEQRLIGFLARKHASLFKAERDAPAELLLAPPTKAYRDVLAIAEQACQQGLPAFMVPEMMWLSKMPFLATSGKLDTKLIIQLVRDADKVDNVMAVNQGLKSLSAPVSALSASEKEVTAALAEVLGNSVSATSSSNIRSLGVDSLSGVHLLSVLKRRGFSNVVLMDLLSPSSTIHSLSQKLNGSSHTLTPQAITKEPTPSATELTLADLGPSASHISPADVAAILPCLPLQSSLVALSLNWLHNQDDDQNLASSSSSFNAPYVTQFSFQLEPGTNIDIWRQMTEQVVSSEAVLCTCFVQREHDSQIFQVVLSSPPSPFAPAGSQYDDATSLVSHLSSRPPIRLHVDVGGHVSLLIHHALYDGAAIAALRVKIEHAYRSIVSGQGQSVSSSFDYSLATLRHLSRQCHLSDQRMQTVKGAWSTALKDISPCLVSRHIKKPATDVTVRSTRRLALTAVQLKTKLQVVSTSTALQLATSLVISNLTNGAPSVVYGFTTSLRTVLPHAAGDIDMDQFIGPCLNTVVHTLSLPDATETLPRLAARVDRFHAEVSDGDMPLVTADQIQRWAGLDGKLFDSLLTVNFVHTPISDEPVSFMRSLPGKAKLDLALTVDVDLHADGRIELLLASAGVLDEAQLESAGRLFETLVENASNPDATVGQFVPLNSAAAIRAVPDGMASNSSSSTTSRSNSTSISSTGSTSDLTSVRSLACQLLRLDETNVSSDTSLYRLGLDSINVLPFVKLINKTECVKVTPSAVLRARTLQGVASLVHAAKSKSINQTTLSLAEAKAAPKSPVAPSDYNLSLQQVAGDVLFVATPLQEGMLSASLALVDQAYTYTHTMQLSADAVRQDAPEFSRFFAAVRDTVLACEILRTRFIFTDHGRAPWVGVVSPTEQSDLVNFNVSATGIIHLRIHHALYDAGSIQALWRLLRENYIGHLSGTNSEQAQRQPCLYRPFAKQVAIAQETAVKFWSDTVYDYNYVPATLLDDKSASHEQHHASASFHFALGATDLDSLLATCCKANVALKTAMQLAWAKVLCEAVYTQADVVFGEVIATSSDDASDNVMGPTINTIAMRLNLSLGSPGPHTSIYDAMSQLQSLGDQARGPNGMASLRDVQTAWRSSRAEGVDTSAGLFQSLFVFDGDVSTTVAQVGDTTNPIVPVDVANLQANSASEQAPLYDDYPLIVSFRIRNGVLHGALRAKASESTVQRLGSQLSATLQYVASSSLQAAALDPAVSACSLAIHANFANTNAADAEVDINGSTDLADSVLQLAKQVIGARIRGKVGISTKLINIGLDSISAIRFSNILKKKMGIQVSVFDIIKGASVETIVRKHAASEKLSEAPIQAPLQAQQLVQDEAAVKFLAVEKLGLTSMDQIKSVAPVLSGQRHTLMHWLNSGKRFFEAPWVYRVADGKSVGVETAKRLWSTLCRTHNILQTTFVALDQDNFPDIIQVTLHPEDTTDTRFTAVRDTTTTISDLIQAHIRETNNTPSNLRAPPSRLSFLEASDGSGMVLRVHHALYDAWSIKMILADLTSLFVGGPAPSLRPSLQSSLLEMARFRNLHAEQAYWKQHFDVAEDTVVRPPTLPADASLTAPLGPHFKSNYPNVHALTTTDASKTQTSAAIIVAYAYALSQLTGCSQPTFGLNYTARSLSSVDGSNTLELTNMSLPTMAVAPMTVSIKDSEQQQSIDAVQAHLAELTKFAQADGLHKLAPSYNTHINILFSDADNDENLNTAGNRQALQRHRLGEPLASEYFTTTVPSPTAASTIDGVNHHYMQREQLYFNVLVRNGSISVGVSGDQDLVADGGDMVFGLVTSFASRLAEMVKE
ncbi:NRPS protein [Sporothrix stenoceras]|uniref:NRPS protein n=1 Tax=Sporothrix stenoceras TaxID=5173 RepID=A0ABR3YKP0_9PEZI